MALLACGGLIGYGFLNTDEKPKPRAVPTAEVTYEVTGRARPSSRTSRAASRARRPWRSASRCPGRRPSRYRSARHRPSPSSWTGRAARPAARSPSAASTYNCHRVRQLRASHLHRRAAGRASTDPLVSLCAAPPGTDRAYGTGPGGPRPPRQLRGTAPQRLTRARRETTARSTRWPSIDTSSAWRSPTPPCASARISRIWIWRRSSPATSGPAPSGSPSRQRVSTRRHRPRPVRRPRARVEAVVEFERGDGAVVRPLPQRVRLPLGGRGAEHLPYERWRLRRRRPRSPWSLWPRRAVPTSPPRPPPGRPSSGRSASASDASSGRQRSRQASPLAARPRSSACAISSLRLFDATDASHRGRSTSSYCAPWLECVTPSRPGIPSSFQQSEAEFLGTAAGRLAQKYPLRRPGRHRPANPIRALSPCRLAHIYATALLHSAPPELGLQSALLGPPRPMTAVWARTPPGGLTPRHPRDPLRPSAALTCCMRVSLRTTRIASTAAAMSTRFAPGRRRPRRPEWRPDVGLVVSGCPPTCLIRFAASHAVHQTLMTVCGSCFPVPYGSCGSPPRCRRRSRAGCRDSRSG